MDKHTPGPWWPVLDSAGTWNVATRRDPCPITHEEVTEVGCRWGAYICMGIGDHTANRTRGNEEANARLIAAAPAMHEYIAQRAEVGDNEAKKILESINAGR